MTFFDDEVVATDEVVAEAPSEEAAIADGVESDATEEAHSDEVAEESAVEPEPETTA